MNDLAIPDLDRSLNLHSGGVLIDYDTLKVIPTPEALGPRHFPYPFHAFVDDVMGAMENYGLTVRDTRFAVSEDHGRFFGLMALQDTNSDWQPLVGLRGAHDQSMARGIAIGSKVFVCSNMAFTSEQVLKTKQTTNILRRIPQMIDRAVGNFENLFNGQANFYDQLREVHLTDRNADAILTEVVRRDIVPSSKFRDLVREWDEPSFDHGEHTAYRLYNAVTQVIKPTETTSMRGWDTLRSRTLKLANLMDEAVLV